jgi:hypothetical protein
MSYAAEIRGSGQNRITAAISSDFFVAPKETYSEPTSWSRIWNEVSRTQTIKELYKNSSLVTVSFGVQSLPVPETQTGSTTSALLSPIEKLFGNSATDLARILRVSRQMIYHYRQGMEPSVDNKRRLQVLSALANDFGSSVKQSLKSELKKEQFEGRRLLDILSDEELNIVILRQIISRLVGVTDKNLREKLAKLLSENESIEARKDISLKKHSEGKVIYVGDPESPGKLIQIDPNGNRIRGQMVRRTFVPDNE